MKVILQQDVRGKGKKGQMIEVAEGCPQLSASQESGGFGYRRCHEHHEAAGQGQGQGRRRGQGRRTGACRELKGRQVKIAAKGRRRRLSSVPSPPRRFPSS